MKKMIEKLEELLRRYKLKKCLRLTKTKKYNKYVWVIQTVKKYMN